MIEAARAYDPRRNNWNDETRSNLTAVLVNRCIEDRWSGAAQACLTAVQTRADLGACWDKQLTSDQRDKAERIARAVARAPTGRNAADEPEPPFPGGMGSDDAGADAMRAMVQFTDRICGCADTHDQVCFKKVQDDLQTWAAQNADKMKDFKPSEAELKQSQALAERMSGCMQRLVSQSVGGSAAP